MANEFCCPPGSLGYLASDYNHSGEIKELSEVLQFYAAGNVDSARSKGTVILIPDIWGWNGGHIRNIADRIASDGYYAVIPKLLVPAYNGGTDGDGKLSNVP